LPSMPLFNPHKVINGRDRWSPADLRCPECLPAEFRRLAVDAGQPPRLDGLSRDWHKIGRKKQPQ